jgi:ABC-type multidrug transport system fused ATPase/permease subunit
MWSGIAGGLVLALISGMLSTFDPLLMRRLIDTELPHHHFAGAILLAVAIFGCLQGSIAFLLWSAYLNFDVEQKAAQNLRIAVLEQLNRLSPEFHESTPAGDSMTRLGADVDQISQLGSELASAIVRAFVFFAVNLAVMIRLNAVMAIVVGPSLFLFAWVQNRFSRSMGKRADIAQKETGRASSILYEYLLALPQIQLMCAEKLIVGHAISAWTGMVRARKNQRSTELLYAGAINSAFLVATLLILGLGGYQVLRGVLTIGSFVAFYAYQTRIFEPVSIATDLYSRLQRVGASIRRVRAILELDSLVPDFGKITEPRRNIAQGLSIDKVRFSYAPDRPAVQNLTLHIGPNESLGIVGPNGSGKSTLARLLVRMSDPHSGDITLDGYPLRDYSLAALRQTICYVPQLPILFDGTVGENLRYACPNATDADLERVMAITQFTQVLKKLPKGLNTELGPSGHSLSGGERQRLALARGLLRHAPVLILDESTSAIDLPAEAAVIDSILRNRPASILIVISHRLRSIAGIGRIVVLGSGRVMATGTHEALYKDCPVYRGLWATDGDMAVH